ncbi:MAG: hypothetical protein OCD76_25660 [Reichenbachiella sp.]
MIRTLFYTFLTAALIQGCITTTKELNVGSLSSDSSSVTINEQESSSNPATHSPWIFEETPLYDPDKPLLDLDLLKEMRTKFREVEPEQYSFQRSTAGYISDNALVINRYGAITRVYFNDLIASRYNKRYSLDSLFGSLIAEATQKQPMITPDDIYVDSIIIEYDSTYYFPSTILYERNAPSGGHVDGIDAIYNQDFAIITSTCPDYAPHSDDWCLDGIIERAESDKNGCTGPLECFNECGDYERKECPDHCGVTCIVDECFIDPDNYEDCDYSCGPQSACIDLPSYLE